MNTQESPNLDQEDKMSLPENEVNFEHVEDNEYSNESLSHKEKINPSNLEDAKSIENLRSEIYNSSAYEDKKVETRKEYFSEIETIGGTSYKVTYVPKEDIYPAFGYARGRRATVREDLSPRVKRFVKAHELYHCTDKSKWGGVFGSELRANLIPGLKDPLGLVATIWKTVSDKDRMNFYLRRAKEGF